MSEKKIVKKIAKKKPLVPKAEPEPPAPPGPPPPPPDYVCNPKLQVPPSQAPRIVDYCLPEVIHRSTDSDDLKDQCEVAKENVTVKFFVTESNIVAQVYPNTMTMAEVKQDISRKFEVNPEFIILTQHGRVLCDNVPIYWTSSDDFGIHEFQLLLNLPEGNTTRLNMNVYYE